MVEFITKNGNKKVKIVEAKYSKVITLKNEVTKALKNTGILDTFKSGKFQNITLSEAGAIICNSIMEIDSSERFNTALMDCLACCIYDDNFVINEQLFDDKPEAREDYYEIAAKCCEVNLAPFFKSLVSELKTQFSRWTSDTQAQELQ